MVAENGHGGGHGGLSQSLSGLERLLSDVGIDHRGAAPVDLWSPPFCGDLDMEIRADGTWFYMGTPIGRQALVRLFARVLRKDADGRTYLVTPVERIGLRVEDAHFLAVDMDVDGHGASQIISFRTNVDDVVTVGPDHPLRFEIDARTGGLKPYVNVRGRLEALVSRAVMFDLVGLAEHRKIEGTLRFGVRSSGAWFDITDSASLLAASE